MLKPFITVFIGILFSLSVFGQGNLPNIGISNNMVLGVVKTVGPEKLVVETKDGSIDAILLSVTGYKVLPPNNLSLKAATDSKQSDISAGDRVLITGQISPDKKQVMTKTVYLVKGSAIAAMQDEERADWRRRGISGRIVEIDPAAKTFTVELRGLTGAANRVKVMPKDTTKYLRYAKNSVKYEDAVPSDFANLNVDDMVQVLGDKSADQTSLAAEKLISGSFVTVAGKVKSVDATKNMVTITDLKTNKDLTISILGNSMVKRFPAEEAQRMAGMQAARGAAGAGGSGPQPPQGAAGRGNSSGTGGGGQAMGDASPRTGAPGGNAPGTPGGQRGPRGFDINELLNRFPNITVADLKPGEMIAVSSPKGENLTQLSAIRLLAGIEPFIQMAQGAAAMQGQGNRNRGISGGLNIPGLDGMDF